MLRRLGKFATAGVRERVKVERKSCSDRFCASAAWLVEPLASLRLLADRQIVGGRRARPSRPGRPRRPSRLAPPPTTQGSRRDRLLWVQLEKNVSRLKTEMDQGVVHHEPTSSEPHPDVKVLELIVIAINGSL